MFLTRYIKLGMGIGFATCFMLMQNTALTEATTPERSQATNILALQQGEMTVAQAMEENYLPISVSKVNTVKITPTVNNIQKSKVSVKDVSRRDKKMAKLEEEARKNAEKARIKAEKERKKAEKERLKAEKRNKDKKSKNDKKTKDTQSIENRITSILENYNKTHGSFVDYGDYGILGTPIATKEQALKYLLMRNPNPKLSVSPQEIVDYYYEEAGAEGVRPDAAFAQALKETGYFNYGGTVTPNQNNYCGLGTTSATVKGAYFSSARIGVRAHIQHLLAYATVRPPRKDIVDPRYTLVRTAYSTTTVDTWPGLNGRWAVPGDNYGQDIMRIVKDMSQL